MLPRFFLPLSAALGAFVALVLVVFSPRTLAAPLGDEPTESEVKAALVYKVARFVTWPDSSFENEESPLVIGVLGENAIYTPLERILATRTISDRNVVLLRIADLTDADRCHLVYVPGDAKQIEALAGQLSHKPTLLIGESRRFASRGGHVNFYFRSGSLRFEISPKSVEPTGISLSARLLKLARIVD